MLRNIKELEHYVIGATDGHVGHVQDLYFSDDSWVVRYLVVNSGAWLLGRNVLISPVSIHNPNWMDRVLPVSLTKDQIKNSPDMDADKPVSRQHEVEYLDYYGYPYYWGGGGMWGAGLYPYAMTPGYGSYGLSGADYDSELAAYARDQRARHRNDDPHLRSCNAVAGYQIHASDGEIGHVSSMLIDEKTWAIRYIIVDTSNWWMGHKVLVAPEWITGVNWADSSVTINLSRQAIKDSPPYDSTEEVNRERESKLYQYYGRHGYWAEAALTDS
ncbi:MAG: PRC-barrel domain containing protein [Polaromonas sp.]|nr:PRC-barrel domain containing protein [Polaromonas sp.]